jgi:hypothetical protein
MHGHQQESVGGEAWQLPATDFKTIELKKRNIPILRAKIKF